MGQPATDATLRCECGGAVTMRSATRYDDGNKFIETHECVDCGGEGTLRVNSRGEETTGCLA